MAVQYSPGIVTDGLILNLDAANRKSYSGIGTGWFDLSNSGNNGTLLNGVTFSNNTMVFDGVDDISANATNTTFGNNTTWDAWVNRATYANAYNMFMGRTLPYFGLEIATIIFSNNIGGTQRTIRSTNFTPTNNIWYNLSFTTEYDGTFTIAKIYINGVLNNTSAGFTGAQVQYSQGFAIGDGRSTTPWYPFNGNVSNVKIYNRTLSSQEIQQNFNALRGRFGI
jgi:hypothetical protein